MNREAYESFVARVEADAQRHPSLYRLQLGGLAALGYAYVAAVLALLLLVLAWCGWMILRGRGAVIGLKLGIVVVPTLRQALAQPRPQDDLTAILASALKRRTGSDDTHPCLADRLEALGAKAVLPQAVGVTAAEALLGPFGAMLEKEFDGLWLERVRDSWRERHQFAMQSRSRLAELEAKAATAELSIEDALQRATLTEDLMVARAPCRCTRPY